MFELKGRTALITGAGQNVGAEIGRLLASQGAVVVINDLFADRAESVARDIVESGGEAIAITADVTDLDSVRSMATAAIDRVGPVDILVNNAGVPPNPSWDLSPFHTTDPASWSTWIDVSLYGVLNCTHALLPGMVERNWGRVINIVSEGGRTGEAMLAVYCAAKAGAAGFSRSVAKEVAPHGVTVNAISLGTIWPPDADPELTSKLARRYPVGRVGAATDVAPAVLWLASDEAAWVTGQTIPVNGGLNTN